MNNLVQLVSSEVQYIPVDKIASTYLKWTYCMQKQYIFLHKMVVELINQEFDLKENEENTSSRNVAIYENLKAKSPIYENVAAISQNK